MQVYRSGKSDTVTPRLRESGCSKMELVDSYLARCAPRAADYVRAAAADVADRHRIMQLALLLGVRALQVRPAVSAVSVVGPVLQPTANERGAHSSSACPQRSWKSS
jgi:hypothetical protein